VPRDRRRRRRARTAVRLPNVARSLARARLAVARPPRGAGRARTDRPARQHGDPSDDSVRGALGLADRSHAPLPECGRAERRSERRTLSRAHSARNTDGLDAGQKGSADVTSLAIQLLLNVLRFTFTAYAV